MDSRLPPKLICFGSKPPLDTLCIVVVSVQQDNQADIRTKQILKCRELIFKEPLIIASPDYESDLIFVVMQRAFYKHGNLQLHLAKMGLKQEKATAVTAEQFEACLHYTLLAKLAPYWNKVGKMLVKALQIVVTQDGLHAAVQPLCIKMLAMKLHELNISPKVIQEFSRCPQGVIQEENILQQWCHVLPSMKKGQVIEVSHTIPPFSPFKNYGELKRHWKNHYGYRLPEKEEAMYYNVYFKLISQQLFTYPACCIKSGEPHILQCTNPGEQLAAFFADVASKMPQVCGQPLNFLQAPGLATNYNLRPVLQALHSDEKPNIKKELPEVYCKQATQPNFTKVLHGQASRIVPVTPFTKKYTPATVTTCKPSVSAEFSGVLSFCQKYVNKCSASSRTGDVHKANVENYASISSAFNESQLTSEHQPTSQRYRPIFTSTKSTLPASSKIVQLERDIRIIPSYINSEDSIHHFESNQVAILPPRQNTAKIVPVFKKPQEHQILPAWLAKSTVLKIPTKTIPIFTKKVNTIKLSETNLPAKLGKVSSPATMMMPHTFSFTPTPQATVAKVIDKKVRVSRTKELSVDKKAKSSPKINENVDVEALARANQLGKLKVSTLIAWLKENGVAVRAKDKKPELIQKVGMKIGAVV